MNEFLITTPDDMHLHVRDGDMLRLVLPFTVRQFGRAVIMPNLKPPISTAEQALAYQERVQAAAASDESVKAGHAHAFTALMTLYLTEQTTADELERAKRSNAVLGVKYYPAGATTNSDAGVGSLERVLPVLQAMQELDLPLLVHGESADARVDIFDRERVFLEQAMPVLLRHCPRLRVVLEHLSTAAGVAYVKAAPAQVAATITPQHLRYQRNHLLAGGVRPHYYCLPILKRESDRVALLDAATSGNPKFFLGTDSAPHARPTKETACGCAGVFSATHALEHYAAAFEEAGRLERLGDFASRFGAEFYRLPRNHGQVLLRRQPTSVPPQLFRHATAQDRIELIPMAAGETLAWHAERLGSHTA